MTETLLQSTMVVNKPDVTNLITEDDTPVDNIFSAKQQRLLVEPLYSSWSINRPFVADANVGVFGTVKRPPIVPDMFLSLDVEAAENWWAKEHRSYFLWEFGKPPDVVVEIVSNIKGGETDKKFQDYARLGVPYYVIYDPQQLILLQELEIYELHVGRYISKQDAKLELIGLSLKIWPGVFESGQGRWLRWCDLEGNIIPTGAERAEQEHQRAERLLNQLKALGVDPEEQ